VCIVRKSLQVRIVFDPTSKDYVCVETRAVFDDSWMHHTCASNLFIKSYVGVGHFEGREYQG